MQVFISHKSKDKEEAKKIKKYLERCFIKVWLDKDELKGGDTFSTAFINGIKGNTTLIFLSEEYIDAPWCQNEFNIAYNQFVNKKGKIIPVMPSDEDEAKKIFAKAKSSYPELYQVLESVKYETYNPYKPDDSCKAIAEAVQKGNSIRMKPLKQIEIVGQPMQFIDFEIDRDTPLEVFQTWDCDIMHFMDFSNDGSKPIKKDIPIALFGKGPAWFYAYICIPFANKNEVFIFNEPTGKYVCVYARDDKKAMLGKVLK
jgi:hypothetical protein